MSNNIKEEINVYDLFSKENNQKYVIPLYQRAFAWEKEQIFQLIQDINSIDNEQYFLGNLIVAERRKEQYEVIDGQQRLTTLYILFNVLEIFNEKNKEILSFECREKSNYVLKNLDSEQYDKCENSIIRAKEYMNEKFVKEERDNSKFIEEFKEKLKKVKMYRIRVPDHTDLNRYFEIMNTRGEQLEQQDILKAKLMSNLTETKTRERFIFSKIWDACRNIDGYVQMNFNPKERGKLFGNSWGEIPEFREFKELDDKIENDEKISENKTIDDIIKDEHREKDNGRNNNDEELELKRFESIINFPYFLLHTLRVFVNLKEIKPKDENQKKQLDDNKLVKEFENAMCGKWKKNNVYVDIDKREFTEEFITFLLKLRFLFDKYIIKRDYKDSKDKNNDGKWSLKQLKRGKKKSENYENTKFQKNKNEITRQILMLQACFRVTDISPQNMKWITELLTYLAQNENNFLGEEYKNILENEAKERVREFIEGKNYYLGVDTPHIVFNYLDYILWEENQNLDFEFQYRNSVEHWYPQRPDGGLPEWNEEISEKEKQEIATNQEHIYQRDYFGNLCIIQSNINSKFSNIAPTSKKRTYTDEVNKGSLKLRKMANLADNDKKWKEKLYKIHGEEMIDKLKNKIQK